MKKLEILEMETIEGGSSFWDGFCAAVGVASLVGATENPVGAVLVVGCVIYAFS